MALVAEFVLSFEGRAADDHVLDFYDAAEALTGFQRSLALTTHLVINHEIITQAPALKGARIFILPLEQGSWKATAAVITAVGTAAYALGTAPKDTPIGHLVRSAYDYAVSQSLGIHVDYEKSLGQSLEEARKARPGPPPPTQSQVDALIEKIEPNVRQMHRPIIASQTAGSAYLFARTGPEFHGMQVELDRTTYEYINFTDRSEHKVHISGRVTSYNINTFKGRIYTYDDRRPVPFILAENARTTANSVRLTSSLNANALSRARGEGDIECRAYVEKSKTGVVKRYILLNVEAAQH